MSNRPWKLKPIKNPEAHVATEGTRGRYNKITYTVSAGFTRSRAQNQSKMQRADWLHKFCARASSLHARASTQSRGVGNIQRGVRCYVSNFSVSGKNLKWSKNGFYRLIKISEKTFLTISWKNVFTVCNNKVKWQMSGGFHPALLRKRKIYTPHAVHACRLTPLSELLTRADTILAA